MGQKKCNQHQKHAFLKYLLLAVALQALSDIVNRLVCVCVCLFVRNFGDKYL